MILSNGNWVKTLWRVVEVDGYCIGSNISGGNGPIFFIAYFNSITNLVVGEVERLITARYLNVYGWWFIAGRNFENLLIAIAFRIGNRKVDIV